MNLDDYSLSGESVKCRANVRSVDSTADSGSLGCTNKRILFVSGERITDISLDSITSIEYRPPSYLNWGTVLGTLFAVMATILWMADIPLDSAGGVITLVTAILAIVFVIIGLVVAQAKIKIRTANMTHTFRGRDSGSLREFPTAVRSVR